MSTSARKGAIATHRDVGSASSRVERLPPRGNPA